MKKRPKILVVGSLVMDLIVGTERFPGKGETVLGTFFSTATGGKGTNQAVQAARLGADVTMVGKVGNDDFGRQLIQAVSEAGVNTQYIKISESCPSAIGNIQIETNGQETNNRICVVSGANMDITLEDVAFLEQEIVNYDMVVLQLEIPMEINEIVAKYAAKKNVPVMLNTAPFTPIPEKMLPMLTYIAPNEHEASAMSGIEVHGVKTAEEAVKILTQRGIQNVIITLGSLGAVLGTEDGFSFYPAFDNGPAIDPTAAGDSFVGAFCTAVCSGHDHKYAMEFANVTAAITVTKLGVMPSLPTINEVNTLMEK